MAIATAAGSAPVRVRSHCSASCTSRALCRTVRLPTIVPVASMTQSACSAIPQSTPTYHANMSAAKSCSSLKARPSREWHQPCTGARGATSHWRSLTVHLAGAQVSAWRSRRRAEKALPTRWPSSWRIVLRRVVRLWNLPAPWTPRTRPPRLGKRTERVSHSSHRRTCFLPSSKGRELPKGYKGQRRRE